MPYRVPARASGLVEAIAEALSEDGRFPARWRPEDNDDGGLIERLPDGTGVIHRKAEVGMMRCEPQATERCGDARDAALAWLKGMFPNDIDGITIDWNG